VRQESLEIPLRGRSAEKSMNIDVSVIIPTHNPDSRRLQKVIAALQSQTLPRDRWEIVLVDNVSTPAITVDCLTGVVPENLRIVNEARLGLTAARKRGFRESTAPIVVFVDDDNLLAPDYLMEALQLFDKYPQVGAMGGRSLPDFERNPASWQHEFFGILALRDLGDKPIFSPRSFEPGTAGIAYPTCAPVGAGMAIRRTAIDKWLERPMATEMPDRSGRELSSAGDNDIVYTILKCDWQVAYFPELLLIHLIPAGRLTTKYLARLNHGIQKSWMRLILRHTPDTNPWPMIPLWTVPLRKLKAWFTFRAWSSQAAYIRWRGACGHFDGRIRHISAVDNWSER
jgi:glycosyltransferase involved in cell wall biosynthesis